MPIGLGEVSELGEKQAIALELETHLMVLQAFGCIYGL